jgi:agmatinase
VLDQLPAGSRCYVSIDIDVLDMSLVPGCVSAEPDGLLYRELVGVLEAVAARVEIIGVDLVEVNPMIDLPAGPTSYLAAHILVALLGALGPRRAGTPTSIKSQPIAAH